MKIVLFSLLLLVNLEAFSLDTQGFQELNNPKALELARTIDDQFKSANKSQGSTKNNFAENIVSNIGKQNLTSAQKEFIVVMEDNSKRHLEGNFMSEPKELNKAEGSKIKNGQLYIFITLAMRQKNIEALIKESRKYGAIVVIRGLKNGSFIETASFLREIAKQESEGVVIDPTLFKKYRVTSAPTFVLAKECTFFGSRCDENYDLLEGNVTITYALKKMKSKGDLANIAGELLG